MENLIKGWITSIMGLAGMIATFLHGFGIYEFPTPGYIGKGYECLLAFCLSLALFILPKSRIEALIDKVVTKKSDQL